MRKCQNSVAAATSAIVCLMSALGVAHAGDIADVPLSDQRHERLDLNDPHSRVGTATLDETDALAALEGIGVALVEVADGGAYVWHRRDGKLSGMAQPTSSFKDRDGQPCRHIVVALNSFARSRTIEGIACRAADGNWLLTG